MEVPLSIVFLAVSIGFFIGAVGVGGVLLIPPLTLIARLSVQEASATALFTFLFTGLYGTWLFQRRGSIEWRIALPVCLGSIPFAYLGAWINSVLASNTLQAVIAAVVVVAGMYALAPTSQHLIRNPLLREHRMVLVALGAVCGLGSGITGAGGPLFSVPLMMISGFSPLLTIGTSQVLQIAAASAGSLGNFHYGTINFGYAGPIIGAELSGVYLGVRLAHWLNAAALRSVIAILCIAVGSAFLLRLYV